MNSIIDIYIIKSGLIGIRIIFEGVDSLSGVLGSAYT